MTVHPGVRSLLIGMAVSCGSPSSSSPTATPPATTSETLVYSNDFNGAVGTSYPEWSAAAYAWTANAAGTIAAGSATESVTNIDSPNLTQRFLGELGGPIILSSAPYDPQHFVRVNESITLTVTNLPAHTSLTLTFDLYVLKSWDGSSPTYGPDRWSVTIDGVPTLLSTTFSNNFKTSSDLSFQDYPAANSTPESGASATNTLGYGFWFGDSTYHLTFTVRHTEGSVNVTFSSSLNEGKNEQSRGTRDESWGLDNVRVSVQ